MSQTINTRAYYAQYHGHPLPHLEAALVSLRQQDKSVIFLAGDSSLDNKFEDRAPACNGYETILAPAQMKQDVCYWLNRKAEEGGEAVCCINSAVEATSLNSRWFCALEDQDQFIRDNITEDDVLVVSVGGNDIALAPVLCTCANLSLLLCCTPQVCIEHCACAHPPSVYRYCGDPGCCMCGLPGCITGLVGWPLGFGYFVDLFKNRVSNYVHRLVAKRKPKKVVICMIYYLEESGQQGSWADPALHCLGYQCCPGKLQATIRKTFEWGTRDIRIEGTEVVPFPLFRVLDGKTPSDYLQRVEPSPSGGAKMAQALLRVALGNEDSLAMVLEDIHAENSTML